MKTQYYRLLCKHGTGQILYRIEGFNLADASNIASKRHFDQTGYWPDVIKEMPQDVKFNKKVVDKKQHCDKV
jgi:hypothetical protein